MAAPYSAAKSLDVGDRQAGDRGDPLGREARQHFALRAGRSRACARRYSRGRHSPSRTRMCIRPSASAASVPMRIGRCQSASARGAAAARVDHDELDAALLRRLDLAPRNARWWRPDRRPRRRSDRLSSTASGSAPPTGPTVMFQASSQQVSHTVPAMQPAGAERVKQAEHAGRGSSGPDARCRRSRAAPAAPTRR